MKNSRDRTLLEIIRQGLLIYGRQSNAVLGDRSSYVGLSDLAKYAECPRQAVLAKYRPAETSLEKTLTLQRGHWFEEGIGRCFSHLGLNVLPQLEISLMRNGTPLKAHLDFVIAWQSPAAAVRIVEIKSMGKLAGEPYYGHEYQAQGQVNLLCQFWNRPVFALRKASGELLYERRTFPQICQEHFGISFPLQPDNVSVENWLLYISMTEAGAFGPYVCQKDFGQELFTDASGFWQLFNSLRKREIDAADLPHAGGFHLLCACCPFNADCPKFEAGDNQPQWEAALARLDALKATRQDLDNDIKELETALKEAHRLSGVKGWISTGLHKFRASVVAGRRTLDRQLLTKNLETLLEDAHIEGVDIGAFLTNCEKVGSPSLRLNTMTLNGER